MASPECMSGGLVFGCICIIAKASARLLCSANGAVALDQSQREFFP
jgi:hypothetical protein